jgi:hypothetical protein
MLNSPCGELEAWRSTGPVRIALLNFAAVALSKLSETITVLSGHCSTITGPSSVETSAAPIGHGAIAHDGTGCTEAVV